MTGNRRLNRAFRKLPAAVQIRIADEALKPAAQIVAKEARKTAPVGPTGNLRKGIRAEKAKAQKPGTILWHAVSKAQHAYLVGFGSTKSGERFTKDGRSTGVMPANPFMSRAADRMERRAKRVAERLLWRGIRQAARQGFGR